MALTPDADQFSQFLRLAFLRSPNYLIGVSGWTINQDGSAEFNNLTIRGTFKGTNFIINSSGAFFYSGTPALGNLVTSIAPAAGTDQFGNPFKAGTVSYDNSFGGVTQISGAIFNLFSAAALAMQLTPSGQSVFNSHGALIYNINVTKDAWFLYTDTGSATQGALIASAASAAGTDQFGNAFQAGIATYSGATNFAQLIGIALSFHASGNTADPQVSGSASALQLNSGQTAALTAASLLVLIPVAAGAVPIARLTGALQLVEAVVPAAASGVAAGPVVFGNASGHLGAVSDSLNGDGNTYDTERLTVRRTTDFLINSTTPQTIMSKAVGIGTYEVEVWLVTQNTTAADAAGFAFTGPASIANNLVDCQTIASTGAVGYGASASYTNQFNGQGITGNQRVHMLATITFTAAGTLAITGKELVAANTVNVSTGSRMRICPVVAT